MYKQPLQYLLNTTDGDMITVEPSEFFFCKVPNNDIHVNVLKNVNSIDIMASPTRDLHILDLRC